MKKQLIIVGIIVLLVTVGLSGCEQQKSNDDKKKFIGTWKYLENNQTENLWTFYNNGMLKVVANYLYDDFHNNTAWGTFWVEDNKLYMKTTHNGEEYTDYYDYKFSNNNKRVNFTYMGMTVVLDKI
jgi:uncharacterized membrane protein